MDEDLLFVNYITSELPDSVPLVNKIAIAFYLLFEFNARNIINVNIEDNIFNQFGG